MEILRTFELKLFGFMSTGNLIKEKEWFGSQLKSQIAMGYDLLTCEIRENSLAKGYALGVKIKEYDEKGKRCISWRIQMLGLV